jgi:hypothetical protein
MSTVAATLSDLAQTGRLVGRSVRHVEGIPHWIGPGAVGVVSAIAHPPCVLVEFERKDLHDRHPFRRIHLEVRLWSLELVP